ncbi:MAG: hypothetical protein GX560_11225 [Deinococcales bacterium]|nr:hypothetical protein [Deinococcales bacterium]
MPRELLFGSFSFVVSRSGGGLWSTLPGEAGTHVHLLFRNDALVGFSGAELAAYWSGAELPDWVWFLHEPPASHPAPAPYALRVSRRLEDFEPEAIATLVERMIALLHRGQLRPYVPHKTPGAKGWPAGRRALEELRAYHSERGDAGWADRFLRSLPLLERVEREGEVPVELGWPLEVLGSEAFRAELAAARAAYRARRA